MEREDATLHSIAIANNYENDYANKMLKEVREDTKNLHKNWKRLFLALGVLAVSLLLGLIVLIAVQTALTTRREDPDSPSAPAQDSYLNIALHNDVAQDCQGPTLKRSFPDIDYALLGYNVLKGYPLAVGHDPGFTLPIFAADYRAGSQTADCRFSVPKGILLIPDVSCITSFSSEIAETSYAFSKSLDVSVHASGGGWGVEFSASAGYKTSTSEISTGQSVIILSRASCNYYYMRLLEDDAPPFHPVFMSWILKLNTAKDDDVYIEFFEKYGTHYLEEVKFGASFTYEHKMETKTYEKAKSEGVNVAVEASYSGLISVGGGFNMDSEQQESASNFQKSVTTRTITIGAAPPSNGDAMTWASTVKESPVPVTYCLKSIDKLFSETFVNKDSMHGHNIDYAKIAEKIVSMKKKYCEVLRNNGELDNCAELTPGQIMKNTRFTAGSYQKMEVSSSGKCIDECSKQTDCVAITFCSHCSSTDSTFNTCFMYKEDGHTVKAVHDANWEAAVLIPKLKSEIVVSDTDVEGTERPQSSSTDATSESDCFSLCRDDLYCVAYTFCLCPGQQQKCTLYSSSDGTLRLEEKSGTSTHFISRHVTDGNAETPTPTNTTTTTVPGGTG